MSIIVCGLNGVGKSTVGRALADRLSMHFIDIEDLYFPKNNPNYLYASPRSKAEVTTLLQSEIDTYGKLILSAVKGDFSERIRRSFRCCILLSAPRETRLRRVRERSFRKFGERMLPGGDLYEQEESFFELVASRSESVVEDWVGTLSCPVIRVDGTLPIADIIALIVKQIDRSV